VNGAVAQRRGERLVDEAVLIEQREPGEARARDDHLEVVAAAGAILDAELIRVRERIAQQEFESLGSHAAMLAARFMVKREGPVHLRPLA
jgi:hypothetical protein